MSNESPPPSPPAEESIEAETDTALEPEPKPGDPTTESTGEPDFVCDCEEWMRSACKGLPFPKEHEGKRYCVLHYPGKEKSDDFRKMFWAKLAANDFNFCGVWFPDYTDFGGREINENADFRFAKFKEHADFLDTKFFGGANFSSAVFDEPADFLEAEFYIEANFAGVHFAGHSVVGGSVDFIRARFFCDANFAGAQFSYDANFTGTKFVRPRPGEGDPVTADFSSAKFGGTANFEGAYLFCKADFGSAIFEATADFKGAELFAAMFIHGNFQSRADFAGSTFWLRANFYRWTFGSSTDFRRAVFFSGALFSEAVFKDAVSFVGHAHDRVLDRGTPIRARTLGIHPTLDFQQAVVVKPQRVSFHTLVLRPHSFVNVDPRQFVFTDVGWEWERISIKEEIAALEAKVASPVRLLAIACRQLAENAEENNRYEEASNFRYWAMELQRTIYLLQWQEQRARKRMKWKLWWKRWTVSRTLKASKAWIISKQRWRKRWVSLRFFGVTSLHSTYWVVSGYGERISNAVVTLFLTWVLFALMYVFAGLNEQISFPRAFTYSLAVMSLQKPDPRPLTTWAHTLVSFETILGPVQAALLALAIRRKFMR